MKDGAEERQLGGPPSAHRVDDIKAVLSRYGIQRFRYHIWDEHVGRPEGEVHPESLETGFGARDYFERGVTGQPMAFRGGSGSAEGQDRGTQGAGRETDSTRWSVAAQEGAGRDSGGGSATVPWDPPEDLLGSRLPIFQTMVVPDQVLAALQPRHAAPTVSEVGDGESVPEAWLGDGGRSGDGTPGKQAVSSAGVEPVSRAARKWPAGESAWYHFMRRQHE